MQAVTDIGGAVDIAGLIWILIAPSWRALCPVVGFGPPRFLAFSKAFGKKRHCLSGWGRAGY